MPSPVETREALELVTLSAVAEAVALPRRFTGAPEVRRAALLDAVPGLIAYYSDGSSALAADFYEEERELAAVSSRFRVRPVVEERTAEQRAAVAWATAPLFDESLEVSVEQRLAGVVQIETARPFRSTITENARLDPDAAGWRRIANPGACKFCLMLADRGAVYKRPTVQFASHENCFCSAQPVWSTDDTVEANNFQYMASIRQRTPAQRAKLRDYLNANFPDSPG
jgi:hypothetical protein